jgi:hypothetical protein
MNFTFTVTVSVERTQGKFESRDTIGAAITDALEGADPGSITGDNDGEYQVTDWIVEEAP